MLLADAPIRRRERSAVADAGRVIDDERCIGKACEQSGLFGIYPQQSGAARPRA
jgi:hypothetical protein